MTTTDDIAADAPIGAHRLFAAGAGAYAPDVRVPAVAGRMAEPAGGRVCPGRARATAKRSATVIAGGS